MSINVNFFDPDFQNSPFDQYAELRQDAPVYQDPATKIFHVSRFEDVRHVLQHPQIFSGKTRRASDPQSARQKTVNAMFEAQGWLPSATLIGRDEPNHKQMRAMFNEAFRPAKIDAMPTAGVVCGGWRRRLRPAAAVRCAPAVRPAEPSFVQVEQKSTAPGA